MSPVVLAAPIGMTQEPLQKTPANPTPEERVLASVNVKGAASSQATAPSSEVLKAAREFEAIFIRTLLAPLEKTTQLSSQGSPSPGQSTYGSMIVSSMADSLSSAGGIGLSDVIVRALTARSTPSSDNTP